MSSEERDDALNKAAWHAIAKHWQSLYAICMKAASYNPDYADELMSDVVYVRMPGFIDNWSHGPKTQPLEHYITNMSYWHVRKHIARARKRRRMIECSLSDRRDLDGVKDENLIRLEVLSLLETLSEKDRRMVQLVKLDGHTMAETAEIMGISIGHVSGRLKKIIRRLRCQD